MAANITVDIQAKVVGYEASIKSLQQALSKVDPGSEMGKSITKALEQAQTQVKNLSKNMFPKASSDTQIDAIIEKTNRAGEAIQNVAKMMQQLTVGDLNLDGLGSGIQEFRNQISTLESELQSKLNSGLLQAVHSSTALKDTFKDIGTDLSKVTDADALFEELSRGAREAAAEIKKAQDELDAINKKIASNQLSQQRLDSSPLSTLEGRQNLDNELNNIKDRYNDIFSTLRKQMAQGMETLVGGASVDSQQLLNIFFQDLTPENIKEHIKALYEGLSGSFTGTKQEFYNAMFGTGTDDLKNIDQVTRALNNRLEEQVAPVREAMKSFFEKVGGDIDPEQTVAISRLINEDSIVAATEATSKELDKAYARIQKQMKKVNTAFEELTGQQTTAQRKVNVAQSAESNIQTAQTALENEVNRVMQDNAALKQEVENLRTELEALKWGELNTIQTSGGKINLDAAKSMFPIQEAQAYKNELEQVQAKEQLLGKVQGVVQRWFSIYAAVHMVGTAIRSVISTIQELDKTITEIAIVTDMGQSELWDQMPKYTQLARDYASSISGVYQVSQLYYQQGLQTADVMALTEQTLKMARISGLDYAQATDYMTNAVRSFKMEMTDVQNVVDVYSAIAAASASSVTELASAMSKTASSAEAVGSSFENTTAMMAVMIEATRESAENIGSAMKSIISRYGEMTADPTALVDSEGQEMSLNRVDKALQTVGITIHNAASEFRNFDDVIMELAEKWDTIDTNTQRYIATIMAGNRQRKLAVARAA